MVEETRYGRWRPFFGIVQYDGAVESRSLSHPNRRVEIRPFHRENDDSGWEVIAGNASKTKHHGPFATFRQAKAYARKHRDERTFYEE